MIGKDEVKEIEAFLNQGAGGELIVETWFKAKCESHSIRGMWCEICKTKKEAEVAIELAKLKKTIRESDGDIGEVSSVTVITRKGSNQGIEAGYLRGCSFSMSEQEIKDFERKLALSKLSEKDKKVLDLEK